MICPHRFRWTRSRCLSCRPSQALLPAELLSAFAGASLVLFAGDAWIGDEIGHRMGLIDGHAGLHRAGGALALGSRAGRPAARPPAEKGRAVHIVDPPTRGVMSPTASGSSGRSTSSWLGSEGSLSSFRVVVGGAITVSDGLDATFTHFFVLRSYVHSSLKWNWRGRSTSLSPMRSDHAPVSSSPKTITRLLPLQPCLADGREAGPWAKAGATAKSGRQRGARIRIRPPAEMFGATSYRLHQTRDMPYKEQQKGAVMRRLFGMIVLLAWGLWLGGLVTLFMAVTTLFATLDRHTAGVGAAHIFRLFNQYQLAFAAAALLATFFWRPASGRRGSRPCCSRASA